MTTLCKTVALSRKSASRKPVADARYTAAVIQTGILAVLERPTIDRSALELPRRRPQPDEVPRASRRRPRPRRDQDAAAVEGSAKG